MAEETAQTASIWEDPNLMSIMLGMISEAAMGQHGQQTWQAQLGRGATALGQSRKAALAAEEMGKERTEWKDWLRSLISGGEPGGEEEFPGLGLSSGMLTAGGKPYPGTEQRMRPRQPFKAGGLSLYDVLGQ